MNNVTEFVKVSEQRQQKERRDSGKDYIAAKLFIRKPQHYASKYLFSS